MSDFVQSNGKITTLHLNAPATPNMRARLRRDARRRKTGLIIPCHAREFSEEQNRPVFEHIVSEINRLDYLDGVVIGLDAAGRSEFELLRSILRQHGPPNCIIQWNDGPALSKVYHRLERTGFAFGERGKGRNMFLSFGVALALGWDAIALVDADIRSFSAEQVDRLVFPVTSLDHDFSKAYYSRVSGSQVFGRVKRLLVDPLLLALQRKFEDSSKDKVLHLVNFLLDFRYQLSGEVAFRRDLLRRMRFATNWGVEIYSLIEAHRKATSIAQVDIARQPFDHKHQAVSSEDESKGLYRMAIDVVTTLLYALIVEEGLEVRDTFFRDLSITYQAIGETMVKKYSNDAEFNGLFYDRDREDEMVRGVFKNAILVAGARLESPHRLSERFLRFVNEHDAFKPFLQQGLANAIINVDAQKPEHGFQLRETVCWERVLAKAPNLIEELRFCVNPVGAPVRGQRPMPVTRMQTTQTHFA